MPAHLDSGGRRFNRIIVVEVGLLLARRRTRLAGPAVVSCIGFGGRVFSSRAHECGPSEEGEERYNA